MAVATIERFQQALLQDVVLQEQLKQATDPESFARLAVQLGQERGFQFTVEDVKAVSVARPSEKRLSNRQLEAVPVFFWIPLGLGSALPV